MNKHRKIFVFILIVFSLFIIDIKDVRADSFKVVLKKCDNIVKGEKEKINVVVTGIERSEIESKTFSSSDETIASVSNKGIVYGRKKGVVTITVKVKSTSGDIAKDTCKIKVLKEIKSYSNPDKYLPKLSLDDTKDLDIDCDDYSILHHIWRLITIAGPFIYIIFAMFDYFKIVMAGDEESMKKAKKNIPRRLIYFLLFLLVPVTVAFIVGTFTANSNRNLEIFKCVVKGSDE